MAWALLRRSRSAGSVGRVYLIAHRPSAAPVSITPADERVLLALNRYHHLSAEQVRRLLYGRGSLKYAYQRLKRLVDAGVVSHHQARGMEGVYAVSGKGRAYLSHRRTGD